MTDSDDLSVVTVEHFTLFGAIINVFAKIETRIQIAAAGILDIDFGTAIILMGDTHYRQKQQTLRLLNQTRGIDGYVNQDLIDILDDVQKISSLRNAIAHNIWTAGQRPGSIKPMYIKLRGKLPEPIGHWHNEKDYTLVELREAANKLEQNAQRFMELLVDTGLMARVDANIEKIAESTAESPGNPSTK